MPLSAAPQGDVFVRSAAPRFGSHEDYPIVAVATIRDHRNRPVQAEIREIGEEADSFADDGETPEVWTRYEMFVDDDPVGLVNIIPDSEFLGDPALKVQFVENTSAEKYAVPYRGVGKALMEFAIGMSAGSPHTAGRVWLDAFPEAVPFHWGLGFRPVSLETEVREILEETGTDFARVERIVDQGMDALRAAVAEASGKDDWDWGPGDGVLNDLRLNLRRDEDLETIRQMLAFMKREKTRERLEEILRGDLLAMRLPAAEISRWTG